MSRELRIGLLCLNRNALEKKLKVDFRKQPSKVALVKMCSESMQQNYRGTPMLKC